MYIGPIKSDDPRRLMIYYDYYYYYIKLQTKLFILSKC